jgi:hypothetical protein
MPPSKQITQPKSKEAPKMRRANHKSSAINPLGLFAQGVESIIAEKMAHPTQYRDEELKAIIRKEQHVEKGTTTFQPSYGVSKASLFADILKELVWSKKEIRS